MADMQASVPEETKRSFSTEGKQRVNELGQVGLGGGGGSEAGAAGRGLLDGLDDRREGVAEDHRAPGAEEVEVAVAVLVVEIGAFGMGEEGRIAADGAKGADGRVDSAGKEVFRRDVADGGSG